MQRLSGLEILRDMPAQEYGCTSGNHALRQVIIEILFRVGVAGIKSTNTGMRHDDAPPKNNSVRDRNPSFLSFCSLF
jgi:hypothetical protein